MSEIMCSALYWRRILCTGATIGLVLAAAHPVYGQDEPDLEIEDPDTVDDTATQEGEIILVTGSAIERRDLITPAPVTVLDKSVLDAAGKASIGDILQNLPAQSNAINVQFNNGGSGATRINLRGLDAERTLVLINGRRVVPGGTGANSSVDLNSIPSAMVERIEVLKDGASAVYGSDAIGGVVNIITRKDFVGTEANVYFGTSGDGANGLFYDVSVTSGVTSKRGSILVSGGYYQQTPLQADARPYSKSDKSYNWDTGQVSTDGSFTTPQGAILLTPVEVEEEAGNDAWQEILNSVEREVDGSLYLYNDPNEGWRKFNYQGNSDVGEGDKYNYQPENYLVAPLERYGVNSIGHYNFTDNVRGYFEASYTNRKSDQLLAPEPLSLGTEGIRIAADNHYNPFGRSFGTFNRRMVEGGNRRFFQDVDTFRVVAGLDGNLPERLPLVSNWRWDVSANFGRTQATSINEGRYMGNRIKKALGASFMDADGNVRCGTPGNPDDADGCVPLNLFGGPGTITSEMMDYITYAGIGKGYNDQRSLLFSLTGRLIEFPWGGSAGLSLGAERRQLGGGFQPDPLTASGDTTGNKSDATEGNYDVNEVFAELSSYVVEDVPFAEAVEVTGALRAFDYSTFGSGFTWKAGGRWQVLKDIAIRGTVSTAFRAPTVGELFAGQADAFASVSDPCDTAQGDLTAIERRNCMAEGVLDSDTGTFVDGRTQLPTRVGGNTELQSEEALVYTGGIVVEPRYVPGLSLTMDYFNIAIDGAIDPIGTSVILSNCYGNENPIDCDKITRDPLTRRITSIDNRTTNVGGTDTAGIDIGLRYDLGTAIGRFRFNAEGTWLHQFDQIQANGDVVKGKGVYDLGVYPDFKGNLTAIWGLGNVGAGFNTRFISGFTECEDGDCNDPDKVRRDVSPYLTADVFATYGFETLAGNSEIRVGVNNVLDADPATIYNGGSATSDPATYDFLGQFFFVRFVQTM